MLNKIKYHTRNFIIAALSLPSTIIAMIRFRISFIKHRKEKSNGIGLVVDELNSGGLENIVMNLYKGYRQNGYRSFIIIVNNKVSRYIDSLEDDPRQFQILYSNKARLLNYCRIHKIYALHYHFSTFGMRTAHRLGIKTIYTIHNTYVWFTPRMWSHLKKSLKECNHIVAVSDFAKDFFIQKTGFKNVTTINNGIDTEQIKQNLQDEGGLHNRKLYNFAPKDKIIAMVCSFSEQKYHLSLIGAMEKAFYDGACNPKNTKVIMCGPVIDKKIFSRVKGAIKKSNYSKNFLIGDPIKPTEISAFLKNIPDLVILPSLYEGGVPPLLIIEALICNVPVIMTDLDISNGPFAKYIQTVPVACPDLSTLDIKGIRKIVYSKNSPNQSMLAQKISEILMNTSKYRPNLPDAALHTLSTQTMTKKYLKLIAD